MTKTPEDQAEWERAFQTLWDEVVSQPHRTRCCPAEFKTYIVEGGHGAAFPMSRYEDVRALVALANHELRVSVSLILPLGGDAPKNCRHLIKGLRQKRACFVLIADVLPKRALEFLTTLPLARSAKAILKENGLTLHGLARRESRYGQP
jgi:hypothetical protein